MASKDLDENVLKGTQSVTKEIEIVEETKPSAFGNMLIHSDFKPRNPTSNLLRYLFLLYDQMVFKIMKWLQEYGPIKIFISIDLEYEKPYWKTKKLKCSHHCKPQMVYTENGIIDQAKEMIEELLQYDENLCEMKAGLVVSNIISTCLHASKLSP